MIFWMMHWKSGMKSHQIFLDWYLGNIEFKILLLFELSIRRFFSINISQLRKAQEVASSIYISSRNIECDEKCLQTLMMHFSVLLW